MAVSPETDWERIAMYPDDENSPDVTPEQIRKKDIEQRRDAYRKHGATSATGLTDAEFKYVTGLPLSPKEGTNKSPKNRKWIDKLF